MRINAIPTTCGHNLSQRNVWDSYHEAMWKAGTWASGNQYWAMYDQFKCHAEYAYPEYVWNLEAARPNVSYARTVQFLCNPS
jgi:hypothetical protein